MRVICADPSPISLFGLNKRIKRILPESVIHLCKDTESAVQIAIDKGCDVLITEIDFGRDKGEGIKLAEKIGELVPDVNVVFVTAAPYYEYAPIVMKMKYSGFLTKPYMNDELKKELTELRFKKCV